MALMKYLTPYSWKEDPEGWLESYESAAKAEEWSASQMLECVGLKLKKKAKDWLSNLTEEANQSPGNNSRPPSLKNLVLKITKIRLLNYILAGKRKVRHLNHILLDTISI